jgi:glutathione synthase/RimK-type ligase-like ATP-grasp enzyme
MGRLVVIGTSADSTMAHFISFLRHSKLDYEFIPLEQVIFHGTLSAAENVLTIELPDSRFTLNTVDLRAYCRLQLPNLPSREHLARWKILRAFFQQSRGVVVNRPQSGSSNHSKIVQLAMFQRMGILFPDAIYTSEEETLRAWAKNKHEIVFKSGSSIRSIVAKVDDKAMLRIGLLSKCPVLFQQHIAGSDVRVHVVGDECHAEQIWCNSVDYRYANREDRRFHALDLPSQVKKDCLRVTAATGNLFSGIDFKVDEQGNYWMLEVNPMPGYDGYDRRLGGTISRSLVHLLTQ